MGGAQADVDRIVAIWGECLDVYGGPFLFGPNPPSPTRLHAGVHRFRTYDVELDEPAPRMRAIMALPTMREWVAAADQEPDELEELDVEL